MYFFIIGVSLYDSCRVGLGTGIYKPLLVRFLISQDASDRKIFLGSAFYLDPPFQKLAKGSLF